MPDLPQWAWLCSAAVAAAGVVSMLRSLAMLVRNETTIHDLRCKVFDVRIRYLRQLIEMYGQEEPDELTHELAAHANNDAATETEGNTPDRLAQAA